MQKTRLVTIGGQGKTKTLQIGADSPLTVQTMWKESIKELSAKKLSLILEQIQELESLGCDIIRFAVPDEESAESLLQIAQHTSIPLVADIHFDHALALMCLEGNIAAVRINPGNIGSKDRVEKVVNKCKEKGAALRIGVNSGSLPKDILLQVEMGKITRAKGLVEAAQRECAVFEDLGFQNYIVSMKASCVEDTIDANTEFSKNSSVPLHIGVTEAGPLILGIVKSTLAFSSLIQKGIGDTFRVSLSDSPQNEVIAGVSILKECGKRKGGVNLVSCPRCGREGFDVHSFVARWQDRLLAMKKDVTIAVMGCVVNGPGEGKNADLGITGAGDQVLIFKKGKIIHTIQAKDADNVFEKELMSL